VTMTTVEPVLPQPLDPVLNGYAKAKAMAVVSETPYVNGVQKVASAPSPSSTTEVCIVGMGMSPTINADAWAVLGLTISPL
jgi:hypothetical protein